ncbi:hypothetical protein ACLBXM_23105 [Xanthobacteraceae bacterium A53D]
MANKDEQVPPSSDPHDALPDAILKSIVGGARPDEKVKMDETLAAGLTAGAHEGGHEGGQAGGTFAANGSVPAKAPQSGSMLGFGYGTADSTGNAGLKVMVNPAEMSAKDTVSVTGAHTTMGEGNVFKAEIGFSKASVDASSGQASLAKFDVTLTGTKGNADSVSVKVLDHQTKETNSYNSKDVAARADAGDELFKAVKAELTKLHGTEKKAPNFTKDIEKDLRGHSGDKLGKTLDKGDYKKTEWKSQSDGFLSMTELKSETKSRTLDTQAKEQHEKNLGDFQQAIQTVSAAKADLAKATDARDRASADNKTAVEKFNDAKAVVQQAVVKGDTQTAIEAKKAGESAAKDKAEAGKALAYATAEHDEAQQKLADAKAAHGEARDKVMKPAEEEAAKKAADAAKPKPLLSDKTIGKAAKFGNQLAEELGVQQAKDNKTYYGGKTETIISGGITEDVTTDGNTTTTVKNLGQVKIDDEAYAFTAGTFTKGAGAGWAIRAETGQEITAEHDFDGTKVSVTSKDFASASFESKAKVVMGGGSITAEAEAKVAVHNESSVGVGAKVGDVEVKLAAGHAEHAQAGVKAGAHLGFDGLSLEAKAVAEASVKAFVSQEVKLGDVVVEGKGEIYAAAKAEAHASAEVTFNPFEAGGKVKVKASVGAEASFGVGANGSTGLHSANGNGAEVGGGVYIGKLAAKADADLGYKDGKLGISANVSLALLVGVEIKIDVKVDVGAAVKNVKEAWKEVDSVGSGFVAAGKSVTGFFKGLFS